MCTIKRIMKSPYFSKVVLIKQVWRLFGKKLNDHLESVVGCGLGALGEQALEQRVEHDLAVVLCQLANQAIVELDKLFI